MKKLLLFCLISFVALVSDDEKGPAYNIKHKQSEEFCVEYFPYDDKKYDWTDNIQDVPYTASECVDMLLWDKYDGRYYDRCCYVRFQIDGEMHGGCAILTEEQYLDISETIRRIEDGDPAIIDRKTKNSKVYQLDCNSYYIKTLTIASILLALIY